MKLENKWCVTEYNLKITGMQLENNWYATRK